MGRFWDWMCGGAPPASHVAAEDEVPRVVAPFPSDAVVPNGGNNLHAIISNRAGRTVAMDCETTGLSWRQGDRIVSLAGIELLDGLPTGNGFSLVFNPGRPCAPAARRVHGLADEYLALQPPFSMYAGELRAFIGEGRVVAHNASFDLGFINNEFELASQPLITQVPICTLWLYRARFPGSASLDNCCVAYNLNRAGRAEFHGAFVDAALAAALFQGLTDEREPPFHLVTVEPLEPTNAVGRPEDYRSKRKYRKKPLPT